MLKINIVGIGPGHTSLLTQEALLAIERSDYLIGDKRMLAPFEQTGKTLVYSSSAKEIKAYLQNLSQNLTQNVDQNRNQNVNQNVNQSEDVNDNINRHLNQNPNQQPNAACQAAILVSGDIGFYSLAKSLTHIQDEVTGIGNINLICGISSLQYLCSELQTPWDDAVCVSLHGRDTSIVGTVIKNKKVFVLTDAKNTPHAICTTLCAYGLGDCTVSVGEKLSYDSERITTDTAENIAHRSFDSLCVMLIVNNKPLSNDIITHGLRDELFMRGNAPMTKQEIRAVSLAKLELKLTDTVYDVGAGTGSVSIETALQARAGMVYAIEKDPEAIKLLKQNRDKFGVMNLDIVEACAPEGLGDLPEPDKVFIGGSGGSLASILDLVFEKNPAVRVVINAITLETLNDAVSYFKQKPDIELDIVQIMTARARHISEYHLMTGLNPVYIITAQKVNTDEMK